MGLSKTARNLMIGAAGLAATISPLPMSESYNAHAGTPGQAGNPLCNPSFCVENLVNVPIGESTNPPKDFGTALARHSAQGRAALLVFSDDLPMQKGAMLATSSAITANPGMQATTILHSREHLPHFYQTDVPGYETVYAIFVGGVFAGAAAGNNYDHNLPAFFERLTNDMGYFHQIRQQAAIDQGVEHPVPQESPEWWNWAIEPMQKQLRELAAPLITGQPDTGLPQPKTY